MNTTIYQESDVPQFHKNRSYCTQDPHRPHLCTSSSGCSSVSLVISFNKLVSIHVSVNYESYSSKLVKSRDGGGHGTL